MEGMSKFVQDFGTMFYVVSPNELNLDDYAFDKVPKFIDNAVPFFLLFIAVEEVISRLRGRSVNSVRDTICSISLGMVQQVFGLWIVRVAMIPYIWIFENYRIVDHFPRGNLLFLTSFLLVDVCYYAFHRAAHCLHLLWAAHAVHHSGERYNFATALRQGTFQPWSSWMFYLPLAALGIPPAVFACHTQLNTVYQFWIHTEIVDKLPWPLEGFLNTPSHHRMHHQPPGNCNYAGVLIIWDRLFGTFKDESTTTVRGVYGLAKPADTFDPFWLNILHFYRLLTVKNALGVIGNVHLIFSHRAVHCLQMNPMELLKGLVTYYPFLPQQRVPLPLPNDPLHSSIRKDLNSREVDFLEGRDRREGLSPFAERPMMSLVAVVGWVMIFIVAYGSMLKLDLIQTMFCERFASVPSLGEFICKDMEMSLKYWRCHWALLLALCFGILIALSIYSAVMKNITMAKKHVKSG